MPFWSLHISRLSLHHFNASLVSFSIMELKSNTRFKFENGYTYNFLCLRETIPIIIKCKMSCSTLHMFKIDAFLYSKINITIIFLHLPYTHTCYSCHYIQYTIYNIPYTICYIILKHGRRWVVMSKKIFLMYMLFTVDFISQHFAKVCSVYTKYVYL